MRIEGDEPQSEDMSLNLAPMIDVVFLLLIFFMVATTFAEQEKELGLDLPAAESGDVPADAVDEIVVNILADGTVRIGGQDYDSDALREHRTAVRSHDQQLRHLPRREPVRG